MLMLQIKENFINFIYSRRSKEVKVSIDSVLMCSMDVSFMTTEKSNDKMTQRAEEFRRWDTFI